MSSKSIKEKFNELFVTTEDEKIDLRAQMLSFEFLAEFTNYMDHVEMKRKELANSIRTSQSYLTQLYRGDRLLNFKTVAKIERALGIKITISSELENKSNSTFDIKYFKNFSIYQNRIRPTSLHEKKIEYNEIEIPQSENMAA